MNNVIALENIHSLHAKIDQLYHELNQVTAQLADIERAVLPDPAQEFHTAYPGLQVPPAVLALIGTQPTRTLQQDKADLRETLAEKHT